jgi:hypothetical protein
MVSIYSSPESEPVLFVHKKALETFFTPALLLYKAIPNHRFDATFETRKILSVRRIANISCGKHIVKWYHSLH